MSKESVVKDAVVHATFSLERTYRAKPERVFAAWADAAQKRVWFAEGDHWTVESFDVDFRTGGSEKSAFRFKNGPRMSNETVYHDIVKDQRIVSSYSMMIGEKRISVSLATVELLPEGSGTRLHFTEQAAFFEGGDGVELRREGWGVLLSRLEALLADK